MQLEVKAGDKSFISTYNLTVNGNGGITLMNESNCDVTVSVINSIINIGNLTEGTQISIYSPSGISIYNEVAKASTTEVKLQRSGLYIVKVGDNAVKVVIR